MAENLGAIIETPGFLTSFNAFRNLKFLASHSSEDIEILCDEVYEMEMGVCTKRK